MQLKNDDDVNTMLMCNHQFSCVDPIELLCTIGRTPDGILNLLETTMTLLMMPSYITMRGGTCCAKMSLLVIRSQEKIPKSLTFLPDVPWMN